MYDQPEKKCGTLDLNRDRIEKTLLGAALEKNMPDKPFVLAVQWHPEMMYDSDQQQKIFKAFVDACM